MVELYGGKTAASKLFLERRTARGRIPILPRTADGAASAACRSAEADYNRSVILRPAMRFAKPSGGWKAARTRTLESVRYVAAFPGGGLA
jgi:hypothetical protein